MALKLIEKQNAFLAGCELWLISEPEQSHWAQKLDWRLNFQLRRASQHRSRELSREIRNVIAEFEIEIEGQDIAANLGPLSSAQMSSAPLMIASKELLPNSKTVSISQKSTAGEWVAACHKTWKELGRPSTRVFLPDEMTFESFRRGWPGADLDLADIEVL